MPFRIRYAKTKAGRFLSHLDLMHTWERSIRRSGAPLAFSQGYNPHPKLSFGSALSVGTTSDGEYMDVELTEEWETAVFKEKLINALPPALALLDIKAIGAKPKALMSIIDRAHYQVTAELVEAVSDDEVALAVEKFMAQEEIVVLRFKKNSKDKREVNIRPGVFALNVHVEDKLLRVDMLVQTGSEGNVRPDEVLFGLMSQGTFLINEIKNTHRLGLYVAQEGRLCSPMDLAE